MLSPCPCCILRTATRDNGLKHRCNPVIHLLKSFSVSPLSTDNMKPISSHTRCAAIQCHPTFPAPLLPTRTQSHASIKVVYIFSWVSHIPSHLIPCLHLFQLKECPSHVFQPESCRKFPLKLSCSSKGPRPSPSLPSWPFLSPHRCSSVLF